MSPKSAIETYSRDLSNSCRNNVDQCEENELHLPNKTLYLLKYYAMRLYIIFWHELSMDPAVRSSPYVDPPKDEVKMPWKEKFYIRRRRIFFLIIHGLAICGLYQMFTGRATFLTIVWCLFLGCASSIGVTAGAHRLWSHRAYKARWPLRLILALFQTLSVQYSIYNWVRDHRLHHKLTDTDADPHNSRRGFFFSHIGWSVIAPHPDFVQKVKTIHMDDIKRDRVVMLQLKCYKYLVVLVAYVIPTIVPWYFWNEDLFVAHCVAAQFRQVITLHGTFLINSVAHMWGTRPYDKNINPTENMFVSAASFGDGWHNYHHVFPWDYKNAELLNYKLNLSTAFIDLCAKIGWAYEMKTVPADMVAKRARRTGDGTRVDAEKHVWGWNDQDMPEQDKVQAEIKFKEI